MRNDIVDLFEIRAILIAFGFKQPSSTPIKVAIFLFLTVLICIYHGMNPFSPFLVEVIIVFPLILGVCGFIVIADFFVTGIVGALIMLAAPFGIGLVEKSLRSVLPANDYAVYKQDTPVKLKMTSGGDSAYVEVTNISKGEWLANIQLKCVVPSKVPEKNDNVGVFGLSAGAWTKYNESFKSRVNIIFDRSDYELSNATCVSQSSLFYKDPKLKPEFTFRRGSNGSFVFAVKNTNKMDLVKISFSCVVNILGRVSRHDVQTFHSKNLWEYRIKPDETAYFVTTDNLSAWELNHCDVKEAKWS